MVNYLTSVGVQQVSITIASNQLTGTAAINKVGTGAFIRRQGSNPSDTAAQLDDTEPRIELTSTVLATATRGVTGSSQTIVVNGVIIDGDPTNLVKSVQSGTITVSSPASTNTASINPVTNNNTELLYLGQSYAGTTVNYNEDAILSLVGTTVTADTTGVPASGSAVTVGYIAIEYQGAVLASSVQNVTYDATESVATKNLTITSVATANTMIGWGGHHGNGFTPSQGQMYAQLTSNTNVKLTWNSGNNNRRRCNLNVTEFKAGVLNQAVQRGTISLAAQFSNAATIISSSLANGFVNWLNNSTNSTLIKPEIEDFRITQPNPTTITMISADSSTGTGSWEVITFPAFVATNDSIWFGAIA